jgi:catechol 2,3-dioxygenase-like lactoylglutathione lyase family enzyme
MCEIEYVVLRCSDIERSRTFYEALGLRLVPEQHGRGPKHYSCAIGAVVLELYPLAQAGSSGVRLGIRTPSVGTVLESLRAIGATIVRVNNEGAAPSAVVRDPDGHTIALSEAQGGAAHALG